MDIPRIRRLLGKKIIKDSRSSNKAKYSRRGDVNRAGLSCANMAPAQPSERYRRWYGVLANPQWPPAPAEGRMDPIKTKTPAVLGPGR